MKYKIVKTKHYNGSTLYTVYLKHWYGWSPLYHGFMGMIMDWLGRDICFEYIKYDNALWAIETHFGTLKAEKTVTQIIEKKYFEEDSFQALKNLEGIDKDSKK